MSDAKGYARQLSHCFQEVLQLLQQQHDQIAELTQLATMDSVSLAPEQQHELHELLLKIRLAVIATKKNTDKQMQELSASLKSKQNPESGIEGEVSAAQESLQPQTPAPEPGLVRRSGEQHSQHSRCPTLKDEIIDTARAAPPDSDDDRIRPQSNPGSDPNIPPSYEGSDTPIHSAPHAYKLSQLARIRSECPLTCPEAELLDWALDEAYGHTALPDYVSVGIREFVEQKEAGGYTARFSFDRLHQWKVWIRASHGQSEVMALGDGEVEVPEQCFGVGCGGGFLQSTDDEEDVDDCGAKTGPSVDWVARARELFERRTGRPLRDDNEDGHIPHLPGGREWHEIILLEHHASSPQRPDFTSPVYHIRQEPPRHRSRPPSSIFQHVWNELTGASNTSQVNPRDSTSSSSPDTDTASLLPAAALSPPPRALLRDGLHGSPVRLDVNGGGACLRRVGRPLFVLRRGSSREGLWIERWGGDEKKGGELVVWV